MVSSDDSDIVDRSSLFSRYLCQFQSTRSTSEPSVSCVSHLDEIHVVHPTQHFDQL